VERQARILVPDGIVVVGCIVLACLTLGAVGQSGRRRAKAAVCESNLGQWGGLFERYGDDHDGRFNPGWDEYPTGLWMNALRPYYQDRWPLLKCPTATNVVEGLGGRGTFRAWHRYVATPGGGQFRYVSSYGINSWTNDMSRDLGVRPETYFWKTPDSAEQPDLVPVFADSTWHDAWPFHTDPPMEYGRGGQGVGGDEINHFCIDRHDGAVNLLFMDWSARKVGLKELWTLKWHRSFNTEGPWTLAGGMLPSYWPEWMRPFKDY
jgi:prepilin-type processing-associated H-X9-DG protein